MEIYICGWEDWVERTVFSGQQREMKAGARKPEREGPSMKKYEDVGGLASGT